MRVLLLLLLLVAVTSAAQPGHCALPTLQQPRLSVTATLTLETLGTRLAFPLRASCHRMQVELLILIPLWRGVKSVAVFRLCHVEHKAQGASLPIPNR